MTPIKINREDLLKVLEAVSPGLAKREITEQSSCFLFDDDFLLTFNEEIACLAANPLPKIKGAVQAFPLLSILRKLSDDVIEIYEEKNTFTIQAKKKKTVLAVEKELLFTADLLESPKEWKTLPNNFGEAIALVEDCAGNDEVLFASTCVHLHPDFIEACDNYQLARFTIQLPIKKDFLIRKDSAKHLTSFGMVSISETENWVHFKNETGLIFSCRRYVEEFPDVTKVLACKGEKIVLPKGLLQTIDRANIFSSEEGRSNYLTVSIKPNKMKITGKGISGSHTESKKIQYGGEPKKFLVSPDLLSEVLNRHSNSEVSDNKIKVSGENFVYIACLGNPE